MADHTPSLPSSIEHRLEAMLRISQSIKNKNAPAGVKLCALLYAVAAVRLRRA